MVQLLKKQKIYFISLGLLGLVLISSLIILSVSLKDQISLQGSDGEGSLSKCSLNECSDEELALNLKIIQEAISNRPSYSKAVKFDDKLKITKKPEDFKKQLDALEVKLNALDQKEGKAEAKKYNAHLTALMKRFNLAKVTALKKLRVSDFKEDKNIEKYRNLNANINQIKDFLLDHEADSNISDNKQQSIQRDLRDHSIDQYLLAALLIEHQSQALAKQAEADQKNNNSDAIAQLKSNNDIYLSIDLHHRAQNYIHSLNIHKQRGAFNGLPNKWIIDKITQAEKYTSSTNTLNRKDSRYSKNNKKNRLNKSGRPSYEDNYTTGGSFNSQNNSGFGGSFGFSFNAGTTQNNGNFFPQPSHRWRNKNNNSRFPDSRKDDNQSTGDKRIYR